MVMEMEMELECTCATSIANYGKSNFKRLLVQQEVGRWVRVY